MICFCEVPIVIEPNNPHLTLALRLEELKLEAAVNQGWMLEFTMDKIPMVVKIVDLHSLNRNRLYKVRVRVSSDQLLLQCLFSCTICCKCCP